MSMNQFPTPLLARPRRRRVKERPAVSIFAVCAISFGLIIIAGTAYFASLPIAGGMYACFMIILAASYPSYAYMLIFAFAPFAWDVANGPVNMAASEISLALALPVVFIRTPPAAWARMRNPLWIPIILYFLVCIFSTIANANPELLRSGIISMAQMAIYLVICIVVFSVCISDYRSMLPAFYGLLAVMCGLAAIVIVTGDPFVFGLHKNLVGTELMYAVIIAFELWLAKAVRKEPRKLAMAVLTFLVIGLLVSRSRGAWMGTFVGIMFVLMMRRQFTLAIRTFFFLVPVLTLSWFLFLTDEAREYATTIDTQDRFGSMATRLYSLEYTIGQFQLSPVYGMGVGLRKGYDATNVVMSTLAETGIVGLLTFLSIFVVLLWMAWKAQKRIARTDPVFSLLVIGIALMFGKFCHGLVDHYWSRGIIPVWAGAGLVCYAYSYSQRNNPQRAMARRRKAWKRAGLVNVNATVLNVPSPPIRTPFKGKS